MKFVMMNCLAFQDALLVGTAAGVVMLNSAATALAAAASDSDEDYSAFEPRWVGRERARASKKCTDLHARRRLRIRD